MKAIQLHICIAFFTIASISARELPNSHDGTLHSHDQPSSWSELLSKTHHKPPSWPKSYSLTYTFTLPYTAKIQPDAIKYTVTLHRDASQKDRPNVRLVTLNGTNTMIAIEGDAEYEIQPEIDERVCHIFPGGHGAASANALPDISEWIYSGEEELNGQN